MSEIGEKIRASRKELGMTQVEFAKEMCVEQGYISAVENGKEIPSEMFLKLWELITKKPEQIVLKNFEFEKGQVFKTGVGYSYEVLRVNEDGSLTLLSKTCSVITVENPQAYIAVDGALRIGWGYSSAGGFFKI